MGAWSVVLDADRLLLMDSADSHYKIKLSRMDRAISSLVYAQRRRFIGPPLRVLLWALGVEVPRQVEIGQRLTLGHPTSGLVIHPRTKIGDDVAIFHGVTVGRADSFQPEPAYKARVTIGNGVVIAAGATILFKGGSDLFIGDDAVIGANSVITKSVPSGEVWAGNPARCIRSVRDDA